MVFHGLMCLSGKEKHFYYNNYIIHVPSLITSDVI